MHGGGAWELVVRGGAAGHGVAWAGRDGSGITAGPRGGGSRSTAARGGTPGRWKASTERPLPANVDGQGAPERIDSHEAGNADALGSGMAGRWPVGGPGWRQMGSNGSDGAARGTWLLNSTVLLLERVPVSNLRLCS